MVQEETKASPPPKPLYKDEINMTAAQTISGLSPQRFRNLTIQGKVPTAQKNIQGFWKFSEKAVQDWAVNRPRGRSSADGRRMYKVRLSQEELDLLAGATKDTEIEFAPAYSPKDNTPAKPQPAAEQSAAKPSK